MSYPAASVATYAKRCRIPSNVGRRAGVRRCVSSVGLQPGTSACHSPGTHPMAGPATPADWRNNNVERRRAPLAGGKSVRLQRQCTVSNPHRLSGSRQKRAFTHRGLGRTLLRVAGAAAHPRSTHVAPGHGAQAIEPSPASRVTAHSRRPTATQECHDIPWPWRDARRPTLQRRQGN